ncbi:MAG: hypothetical protein A3G80_09170 [Betaproteobacteria bacterium RIFCSPLOWO2_12_FULL_62_13b]|nr:MAG: hypothetical protein A3G80_09170 [Betaproteobacteria bacterium RIFCSPLOWO2_12_FULL_62_13b]
MPQKIELIRSTEGEKQSQLKRLREFKARHRDESGPMLARLQQAVIANQNLFEVLVDAVRCCSLGQITNALFEVGGSTEGACSPAFARPDGDRAQGRPGGCADTISRQAMSIELRTEFNSPT